MDFVGREPVLARVVQVRQERLDGLEMLGTGIGADLVL